MVSIFHSEQKTQFLFVLEDSDFCINASNICVTFETIILINQEKLKKIRRWFCIALRESLFPFSFW